MSFKNISCITFFIVAMCFSVLSTADTVWIDVRSALEHKIDNIAGDARISHSEIVQEIHTLFPDKTTAISLYCRSGGRAGKAMLELNAAGYHNVSNMGSIERARKIRGLIK